MVHFIVPISSNLSNHDKRLLLFICINTKIVKQLLINCCKRYIVIKNIIRVFFYLPNHFEFQTFQLQLRVIYLVILQLLSSWLTF